MPRLGDGQSAGCPETTLLHRLSTGISTGISTGTAPQSRHVLKNATEAPNQATVASALQAVVATRLRHGLSHPFAAGGRNARFERIR